MRISRIGFGMSIKPNIEDVTDDNEESAPAPAGVRRRSADLFRSLLLALHSFVQDAEHQQQDAEYVMKASIRALLIVGNGSIDTFMCRQRWCSDSRSSSRASLRSARRALLRVRLALSARAHCCRSCSTLSPDIT